MRDPEPTLLQKARCLAVITEHDLAALEAAAQAPSGSPARRWLADLIVEHTRQAESDPIIAALLIVPSRHGTFRRPIRWHEVMLWHRERLGLL